MEEIKLNVQSKEGELIIRKGEALPLEAIQGINISGQIDTVARYLKQRKDEITPKKCHILVNRDNYEISLKVNEDYETGSNISGAILLDSKFKEFGINTGKSWTTFELSDFIKMNRAFFQKSDEAAKLVLSLRKFKAKVDKDIENANDNKGNYSILKRQKVESNLPDNFKVNLPIFKGKDPEVIELEVNIDAENFNCTLISPQAKEIEQTTVNRYIDDQIKEIEEISPDIVIINM